MRWSWTSAGARGRLGEFGDRHLGPGVVVAHFTPVAWQFYARSLALAAAQEGVTSARAYGADPNTGISRAQSFLDQQAGDSLTQTSVSSSGSTATAVRIQVSGRALSVLPGIPGLEVTQSAVGSVERFTTDGAP